MNMDCIFYIPTNYLLREGTSVLNVLDKDITTLTKDPFEGDGDFIPYYQWLLYDKQAIYKSEVSITLSTNLHIDLEGERYIVESVIYVPKYGVLHCELTTPFESM